MNISLVLKLATAFVAFSISAHAVEVFHVKTISKTYPVAVADRPATGSMSSQPLSNFYNSQDENGLYLNPYHRLFIENGVYANSYSTNPNFTGPDVGSGTAVTVTNNFDGNTAVNPGDQKTQGANTTTYFGPKFYSGVNRPITQVKGGVCHSDGNGYRIRVDGISAAVFGTAQVGTAQVGTAPVAGVGVVGDPGYVAPQPASDDYVAASDDYAAATGNGGIPVNIKAIFMFDADQSSLSGADDNLIFSDTDTITAKLSVPGPITSRSTSSSYRAMVKANGKYYAGSLYNVDYDAHDGTSTVHNMLEVGADATWTLMPDIENNSSSIDANNLDVDTSTSATTIPGKYLTHITQVGFLLESNALQNSGGYNFGVREFTAHASAASAPHPSGIEWNQDFTSAINFLSTVGDIVYDDAGASLTGATHAFTWSTSGAGLTGVGVDGDLDYVAETTVVQDTADGHINMSITENGTSGQVTMHMVGPGTTNARRVKPVSHEITWVIDLVAFKNGDADLLLTTRGHDGWIRTNIQPSGIVKFTSMVSDYTHTNFDNFNGPSSLRNNASNPGIVIVDGGTFDPALTLDTPQVGTAQVGTAQVGTAQVGTAQVGTAQVGTAQVGTAQVGTAQVGTAQVGTAQVGTAQVGTAQVGTAQVGTAQVGTAQVGTAQVGTAQVGTAQVGTAPVAEIGVEGEPGYVAPQPASDDYVAASSDYAPASDDYVAASSDYAPASDDYAPASDDYVAASSDYVAASSDYAPASDDYVAASDDYAPASDDYVAASSDYAPASDDYVAASSDYAPASDDYVAASSDYAPASDDYAPASDDYVAASSDYAAAIPASDPVNITISGNAVATVNMNSTGDAVESVTLSGDLTGYTALPTVVFTGGGMTEAPTVSFNFSTGNLNTGVIKQLNLGYDAVTGTTNWGLLNDGQTMTYIQSYDSSDDSLSYYYSLTNNTTGVTTGPTFITTLTAAEHSGGGFGFFDVITGNKWGKPNSQDAVTVSYKRYTNADAAVSTVHIDSISVATTDDDRDGVINRNDAFQNNPYESVDTDLDGVGDNSDQHPGYNDSVISAGITQAVWDASQTALTTAQTAKATAEAAQATAEAAQATAETDLSVAQTALSTAQTDLSTAQTDLATAQTDLATAQTAQATAEAALAAAPTLADVQQTVMDARPGSTRIDVVGGKANITLTLEETSAVSDWSSASTTEQTFEVDAPAGTSFYRFKVGEDDE